MKDTMRYGAMRCLWPGSLHRYAAALAVALMLCACAGMEAYDEGRALLAEGAVEHGIKRLEEAVKADPKNAEYRIALASYRASLINRSIAEAEQARRDGRVSDAEKAYRFVQTLDPNNPMAAQGLDLIVLERQHRQIVAEAEALFKKGDAADLESALEKLRLVLLENPSQKAALNLKMRIDDARARQPRFDARLSERFRKPVSLAFRDAPLRSVLEVLAKVSGLNFFYDKDIRPDLKATVFAKNTTVEDALRVILVTNKLDQKVLNDNSILIYPGTPDKIKDYQALSVRSFYLANADVKAVSNTIKTIVKTKDLVIDERLGLIIMRDTPEAIRMAERIVALQDLHDPEVMLEVEILEVKRSRLMELGIQWPSQLTLSPLPSSGTSTTLADLRHLSSATTSATIGSLIINARREDQDGNILANPRIRVRNKEKAKIQIGDRVPVITTTSTSTGFVSESVNYVDVGLKLEVEPNIYLDEEVGIKVSLEVSNLVREILSQTGTLSYQIGTRNADTVLQLKDGETQILAGLISDEDRITANKMPLLGELPVAGRLFGSQKDDTQRSEILLSITPHILRSIRRPDMLAAEFDAGTESYIGAQSLHLTNLDEAPDDGPAEGKRGDTPAAAETPADTAPKAAPAPAPTPAGVFSLGWQAPAQVKVGEQFSAVLQLNSQPAVGGLPLLVGFDPQVLQAVGVQEGGFFRQGNGRTSFTQRIDPAQGRVFIAVVRLDAGVNGRQDVATIAFKALKPAAAARIQLLSASPEPALAAPVALPVEHAVQVVP
ncbi:MAG: general secretion pathway protein GspD [Candidatus Accumulibacter sp.]|nr:general secretion pathway protein GspD [Accumulibacter sp.]